MTFWANCSSRSGLLLALLLGACAQARPRLRPPPVAGGRIAVLPLTGLSGGSVPLRQVGFALEAALRARGIAVVPAAEVEGFLARHRIRWTGGLDADSAEAAQRELRASAALVSAIDLFQQSVPPRYGLRARLVALGPEPDVLWSDAVTLTGDGSPGVLDLCMVDEVQTLQERVLERLSSSLRAYLDGTAGRGSVCAGTGRFAPHTAYRSPDLHPQGATVAVLPFVNETARRNAGDLVSLEFLRMLVGSGLQVVEPGVVRAQLLKFRLVTDQGVSLDTARVVMELLQADFVLGGTVRDFQDPSSSFGDPVVQFTALLLDRKNNEVVWQTSSYHRGNDGVFFFDAGHVGTAVDLTCRMVASALEPMLRGARSESGAQQLRGAGGR